MLKIIIPTCGAECFEQCMGHKTFTAPDGIDVEIIVVANEDPRSGNRDRLDAVIATLEMIWGNVKHVYFPYRIGYTKALDWGWKLADPAPQDLIAVLNDDVVIEGDWITPLVDALERRPHAQVGPSWRMIGPDGLGYRVPREKKYRTGYFNYLEGWCWMAKAKTIAKAGGIVDLGFDGSYCEDCDLSIRIATSAGSVLATPGASVFEVDAPIRHIGHQSSSPETQAQWAKNRLYLAEKWDLSSGGRRG